MILLKCWRYRHMYYWRIYNFVTEMRFAVRKSTAFVKNKKRKHCKINVSASYMRAADGNRTRDLRTTNATLYRLSHSSITRLLTQSPCYILSKVSHFVNRIILNYIFFLHNSFIMLSVTSLRISSGGISSPIWWHWYIR